MNAIRRVRDKEGVTVSTKDIDTPVPFFTLNVLFPTATLVLAIPSSNFVVHKFVQHYSPQNGQKALAKDQNGRKAEEQPLHATHAEKDQVNHPHVDKEIS